MMLLPQAGCIALVDAFQFRNEYMPTNDVTAMLEQVMPDHPVAVVAAMFH